MINESSMTETDIGARGTSRSGLDRTQDPPAAVPGAGKAQTHDRPPDLVKKIGKTTYKVWAHFSETSRETLEDKIHRMLREDVRRAMQAEGKV